MTAQHQNVPAVSPAAHLTRSLGQAVPFEGEGGVFTQSWFPICLSSAATSHFVRGFDFLDGRVIVFRDEHGQAHVTSAYCPHLGADLAEGDMIDGQVRCIFHHWRYDGQGRCAHIPSGDPIPGRARLFKFPVVEKFGVIWAFNGSEPTYDLPDFPYPNEELVFKTKVFGEEIPVDPWILAANTPDMQHIRYVHGAVFDGDYRHDLVEWTDHSMKYTYDGAQVTGERKRQTNGIIGSNMFYQETEHSGKWFGFIAPFGLVRPMRTCVYFIVCTRKDMGTAEEVDAYLDSIIDREVRVALDDLTNMNTIHLKPGTLTRADQTLAKFFQYLRDYPRAHPSADFIR